MTLQPRRSLLYVPGSNVRALERARTLVPDGFIFDLEDAVAPDAKNAARAQVVAALRAGGYEGRETVVRTNAQESAWWPDDVAAIAAAGPDAILIPKVSDSRAIESAAQAIRDAGAPTQTRLWAMIETPRAITAAAEIASAAADPACPLAAFVLGTNDLANETRARQTRGRSAMLAWLSMAVVAARAYRLDVLDGVFSHLDDSEGFREECVQGRDLGMDGKTLIHPTQIAPANEIFGPSAEEIESAHRVVEAFKLPENAGKGAIALQGRMVERLHVDIALRTLALAQAIAGRRK